MSTRISNSVLFLAPYLIRWVSTHTAYCKPSFISWSVLCLPSLCVLRTCLYVKHNYSSLTRVADGHDHGTRRSLDLVINTTCSIAPNIVLNIGPNSIKYFTVHKVLPVNKLQEKVQEFFAIPNLTILMRLRF